MLTKKVKKRFSYLTIFLALTFIGVFSIFKTLDKNLLYFKSPTDVKADQDISYNIDRFTINNEESHQNELKVHNNSVPIKENHKNTAYEYKRDDRYTIFSLKVPKFPDKDDLIIKIDNIIPITIAILTLFIAFIV